MQIILGSASKQRKIILRKMGYTFKVITADIDEKSIRFADPVKLTLALAHAKAKTILAKIKEQAILITADQVVYCNGNIIEKPEDKEDAKRFLKMYEKYPAEVVSGIVVTNTATGAQAEGTDAPKVFFKQKPIPDHIIDELIKKGDIFYQCGAFSVEDPLLASYIDHIEGSVASVEGLPMKLTKDLINRIKE